MAPAVLDAIAVDQAHRLYERLQLARGRSVRTEHLMDSTGIATESVLSMRLVQLRELLGDDARFLHRSYTGYRWDEPGARDMDPHDHRDVLLDVTTHRIIAEGRFIPLTPGQIRVVQALMIRPGRIVSTDDLTRLTGLASTGSVTSHVATVRRRLKPLTYSEICHVRGMGYQYTGPRLRYVGVTAQPTRLAHAS